MPQGFKFTEPEEIKKGIKPKKIPEIPLEEDSAIMKILTGQPLLKLGEEAQFEHNIRNRRLEIPEYDLVGSVPTAGVTKHLIGGIPDKEYRMTNTARFLDRMMNIKPGSWLKSAADELIKKRSEGGIGAPRVAAHIFPTKYKSTGIPSTVHHETSRMTGKMPFSGRYRTEFNPDAMEGVEDTTESVIRRTAEAAQNLGNPNVKEMKKAWKFTYGTTPEFPEPFELSANVIGQRKMGQLRGIPREQLDKPVNALKMYEDAMNSFGPNSIYRKTLENAMKRR